MVKFRPELKVLDVLSLTISAFSILPLVSPPHVPLARLPYPTAESGPLLTLADQADMTVGFGREVRQRLWLASGTAALSGLSADSRGRRH